MNDFFELVESTTGDYIYILLMRFYSFFTPLSFNFLVFLLKYGGFVLFILYSYYIVFSVATGSTGIGPGTAKDIGPVLVNIPFYFQLKLEYN
jgi:hypothetical protein